MRRKALTATLTILLIAVACCGPAEAPFKQCPDRPVAVTATPWEKEMLIAFGPANWHLYGIAAATSMGEPNVLLRITPQTFEKDGPYARFVMRHEFLHALGWMGHPHSGPDDKVVYMDRAVPENIGRAKPGDVVRLPRASKLEKWYVREEKGVLWIRCEPELMELAKDAADFWNGIAGREVFRFRPTANDK